MNSKISNLRALAIFIVVLGHSIIVYDPTWASGMGYFPAYTSNFLFELKQLINIIQMPLFFSISGFLFYYSIQKNNSFFRLLTSKFRRLIIPFLCILYLWSNPTKYVLSCTGFTPDELGETLLSQLKLENLSHLWYLPTLFFIFIILYHGAKLNNEYKVLFALLVLNFTSRYIPEVFTLRSVAYYLFYFYLGYIINKKHFIERTQAPRYRILMFFMLCGSLIACILFKRAIIVPASLFIICLYSVMTSKDNKAIQLISNNSYGIYLFHSPFVYVTYKYMIDYTPVIVVFTNIVIFGSLSILMTRGIRVSKFRFIIGE